MTREEAIKTFEDILQLSPTLDETGCSVTEAMKVALSALRPVSREKVEKVLRGKWAFKSFYKGTSRGAIECQKCKSAFEGSVGFNFCPHCGAPMTDEAVDILLKRLEALHGDL